MKIADASIRRPVVITMIMLGAVLLGIVAMTGLPLDLYPTMDLAIGSVTTTLPGASPAQVEQELTNPLEEAVQNLSGVTEIDSYSMQNVSTVIVQFDYSVNINEQIEKMRSVVNAVVNQLPSDATTPVVQQYDPTSMPIMTVVLSGDKPLNEVSELAENVINPALKHVGGVGSVDMIGNLKRQFTIQADATKLAYYNLSIQQVVQAIAADNRTADVGQIDRASQLIPLHVNGQFNSPQEILKVPLQTGKGHIVVGDVAKVQDGYKDVSLVATLDGKPSVGFSIKQASGGNTVRVSDAVQAEVKKLSARLPEGVHLTIVGDSAQTIRDTISVVTSHSLFGFLLGILLMLCILRSLRSTVVIAVAIPISILSTFILMYLTHLTINSITLGSLAIALGSLVDFSVVVLESIFRARRSGLTPLEAASRGTQEVGTAVMVAAFAQICVFGPSLFTTGIAGQLFGPMALTVTSSHVVALLVALTLTPMLASKLMTGTQFASEETVPGITAPFRVWAPFDWSGRGMHELTVHYKKLLNWGLNHRKTVVGISVLMFVAVMPLFKWIGTELISAVNGNQVNVTITLAGGTSLDSTAAVVKTVEERIRQNVPEATSIYTQVGGVAGENWNTTNSATLIVKLKPDSKRKPEVIANEMQPFLDDIAGAKIIASPASAVSGPETGMVQVLIQGPDLNTLRQLSNQVSQIMQGVPELRYIDNQLATGLPSYQLDIDRDALAQYGISEEQVINELYASFQGAKASSYFMGDNRYDILVQFPEDYSRDPTKLSQISVMNATGQLIPLKELASLKLAQQPAMVSHVGGLRAVYVMGNVYGATVGEVQAKLAKEFTTLQIPAGYDINFGQYAKFQSDAFRSLGLGILVSVILVYMVMAGMFESFLTPFVIMFSLPPTFVGAVLGLFLTHKPLNMNSLMGMVMLVGLVTNNAIVLIDYTNQLRARGLSLTEALLTAGPVRLRPILLTTVTNVAAMLPLLLFGGTGADILASIAAVITFGLTISTLVTLILVPVMYVNMDRFLRHFRHGAGAVSPY